MFDPTAIQPPQQSPSLADPVPVAPPPSPTIGEEDTNPAESAVVAAKPDEPPKKWKVIPFAGFEVSWTDNLFISATRRRSDFFSMISPGLAAGWGDYGGEIRQLARYGQHFDLPGAEADGLPRNYAFAKYSLNARFFAENSDQNAVNHDAMISGRWERGKLTVGARFYFQTISDVDVMVGGRTDRTVHGGEITSSYSLGGKTSVELNISNRSQSYDRQLSWQEWMAENWFTYQIAPKTKVSLGSRLGLVNVESSPTQTFEQLVGRVTYAPGAKLGFNADGGVEWRQFGRGRGGDVFGVFNFSGTYAPFDGMLVAVNAYRRNSASAVFLDESITATGFSARLQQRFMQRYFLTMEGGYDNSIYRTRGTRAGSVREDGTTYIRAGVSCDVTKNVSAEASYQHRENDSSRADLSFTENVFFIQFKFRL